jgi:hypothetical protein
MKTEDCVLDSLREHGVVRDIRDNVISELLQISKDALSEQVFQNISILLESATVENALYNIISKNIKAFQE